MGDDFNLSKNPGWALWNRSKRISETVQRGRQSELILAKAVTDGDWPPEELDHLRQLTAQLRECADQARAMWRELEAVLYLPTGDQLGRIREIGGALQSNTESWYLIERVEYLDTWVRKFQDS
ncbi:MAG TPA: hypothetical protein VMV96_04795 [Acidimicrobiales bacterium]|nr:hypothetical protein [Acidimicrobiales bacterium]